MTVVELRWQVRGDLPADYAYGLFSAVCRRLEPWLHDAKAGWSMSPVVLEEGHAAAGRLQVERGLLCVRCPVELVGHFADIRTPVDLTVQETGALHLAGAPTVHALRPQPRLGAERVTIKGRAEGSSLLPVEAFEAKLAAQVSRRGIARWKATVGAPFALQIMGQSSHGYAVELDGLSASDSLELQRRGIGGRTRMGCGFMWGDG